MGRPHKLTLHQRREAIRRRDSGKPVREIARSFSVHRDDFQTCLMEVRVFGPRGGCHLVEAVAYGWLEEGVSRCQRDWRPHSEKGSG